MLHFNPATGQARSASWTLRRSCEDATLSPHSTTSAQPLFYLHPLYATRTTVVIGRPSMSTGAYQVRVLADCQVLTTLVIRFVDRDMFVRHLGCGLGHLDLGALNVERIRPADYLFDDPSADPVSEETGDQENSDPDCDGDGEVDEGELEEDNFEDVIDSYATL